MKITDSLSSHLKSWRIYHPVTRIFCKDISVPNLVKSSDLKVKLQVYLPEPQLLDFMSAQTRSSMHNPNQLPPWSQVLL